LVTPSESGDLDGVGYVLLAGDAGLAAVGFDREVVSVSDEVDV
jgi:hypothetical protein